MTCKDLSLRQDTLQTLPQEREWGGEPTKVPGPGTSVKFWGVIWSDTT